MTDISQSANVKYATFSGFDPKKNTSDVVNFIHQNGLARNQIVSITANQLSLDEEKHQITLFYRDVSIDPTEFALSNVEVVNFDQKDDWEFLHDTAVEKVKEKREVLGLTHTAMKLAQFSYQHLFSFPVEQEGNYNIEVLTSELGNLNDFAEKVQNWINSHIKPHELVSLSIFEGEHDPTDRDQTFYGVITHTGAEEPEELPAHQLPKEGLYSLKFLEGPVSSVEDWRGLFDDAVSHINQKGGDQGHLVATANNTPSVKDATGIVVIISWNKLEQSRQEDQERPAECCTIF